MDYKNIPLAARQGGATILVRHCADLAANWSPEEENRTGIPRSDLIEIVAGLCDYWPVPVKEWPAILGPKRGRGGRPAT